MESGNQQEKQTVTMALTPFEPKNLGELIELSKQLSESSLVPSHFQKKPANAVVAIGLGKSLGLTAFQSLQDIMVVNGKPSLYGDLPKALVEQSGLMEDFQELSSFEALRAERGECTVHRKGKKRPKTAVFTVEMAKKAGLWNKEGPWTNYPGRMLQLKARSEALRDEFPDVLKGFKIAEDIIELEPTPAGAFAMPQETPTAPEVPSSTPPEGTVHEAEIVTPSSPVPPAPENQQPISGDQRAALFADLTRCRIAPEKFKEHLASLGIQSTANITTGQLPGIVEWIISNKK